MTRFDHILKSSKLRDIELRNSGKLFQMQAHCHFKRIQQLRSLPGGVFEPLVEDPSDLQLLLKPYLLMEKQQTELLGSSDRIQKIAVSLETVLLNNRFTFLPGAPSRGTDKSEVAEPEEQAEMTTEFNIH